MASYTSFLNLEKPTTSERLDVLKINSNWDKIDAGVSALNSQLDDKLKIAYDGTSTPNQKFENAPVGFSVVSVIQGKEGNPTSDGAWTIMQFKPDTSNQYGIQMAVQTNSSKLYIRRLYAGTWTSWTLIGGN